MPHPTDPIPIASSNVWNVTSMRRQRACEIEYGSFYRYMGTSTTLPYKCLIFFLPNCNGPSWVPTIIRSSCSSYSLFLSTVCIGQAFYRASKFRARCDGQDCHQDQFHLSLNKSKHRIEWLIYLLFVISNQFLINKFSPCEH